MKSIGSIFVLVIIFFPAMAQPEVRDFIVKDSVYQQGELIREDADHVRFRKLKRDPLVTYSANEITEYGYEGTTYRAITFAEDRKFYQELFRGKIKIYVRGSVFLFEDNDGVFKSLNSGNFRSVIAERMECPPDGEWVNNLRLKSKSINFGLTSSARNGCNTYIPRMKFGLSGGYLQTTMAGQFQKSFGLNSLAYYKYANSGTGFMIGGFLEAPLYKPAYLYMSPEVYFFSSTASLANDNTVTKFAIDMQTSGVMVPLNLKVLLRTHGVRPYLKGGPMVTLAGFSAKDNKYTETDVFNTGTITTTNILFASSSAALVGINAAGGLEIPISVRSTCRLEARYASLPSTTVNGIQVGFSTLSVTAGVSF